MRNFPFFAILIAGCAVAAPSSCFARNPYAYRPPTSIKQFEYQNSIQKYSVGARNQQLFSRNAPGASSSMTRNLLSSPLSGSSRSSGPISKPFSNVQRGSNLSPYLNIGGIPTGSLPNYYSLVRPQLQQQRQQQQDQRSQAHQQREITRLQQIQAQASQAPFNIQGDPNIAPTGHAAVFQNLNGRYQNYGGYYQQKR